MCKLNYRGDYRLPRWLPVVLVLAFLAASTQAAIDATQLVAAARSQIGVTVGYDPAYRKLSYPNGDVPFETGVCSDVIIRALRRQGVDLQRLVYEDMKANFARYPKNWGLKKPDPNIDHRRVPNLICYFTRQGWAVNVSTNAAEYLPGHIITWDLGNGLSHIGLVSDRRIASGTPLIIHNIGQGAREEDILFRFKITGHFKPKDAVVKQAVGNIALPHYLFSQHFIMGGLASEPAVQCAVWRTISFSRTWLLILLS